MRTKREVPEFIRNNIRKVGINISKIRIDKGLSQEKLAYRSGIAKSFLGYIESGKANPTLETLYLILDGLEVSLSELIDI